MATERWLPFDAPSDVLACHDDAARRFAVDPSHNVVLEASAGTGKTTVLVNRYLNLLLAGVDPLHILAITFTRKAAAEMRQRIVLELRVRAARSAADAARWHDLRDRLGDISIGTIDAFCLSLLREFPLEAGLEPGFDIADETSMAALRDGALDRAVRVCRRVATKDDNIRLLLSQLGEGALRRGLARLLDRRLVARGILRRHVSAQGCGGKGTTAAVCREAAGRIGSAMASIAGGLDAFVDGGPRFHPAFGLVADDLRRVVAAQEPIDTALFRASVDGVRDYFLTRNGEPRKRIAGRYGRQAFASQEASRRHGRAVADTAPAVRDALAVFDRDLNRLLARGVKRAFEIAAGQFRRELESNAVLDFAEVLSRTLALLARMDEFSQSRYRLEARYHHVLLDEFQDTSRAQWRLVSLLVQSWGEGAGLAQDVLPPSVFVVGDCKQSIYGFRDADVTMLRRASRDIQALRPEGGVRRSISRSFRSVPALLSFANDLFASLSPGTRADRFRFGPRDTFPVDDPRPDPDALGLVSADTTDACGAGVAAEIARLLGQQTIVRDPRLGTRRPVTPGDVAILFRSREGHQEYERALVARGVRAYVYKGLGLFDADETKDFLALVDYLAHPESDLAAAALLRSRFVRLSDPALRHLSDGIAAALTAAVPPAGARHFDDEDRAVFDHARTSIASWLALVDRVTPAELVDRVLAESAYAWEMRGPRSVQARENLKKLRGLVRKIQNRGYATLADVCAHLKTLSVGDESNAVVDAVDAVNLMTIHAAKGLEFPVVFLVNVGRGTGGGRDHIRVTRDRGRTSVAIGDFAAEADEQSPEREREETKRLLYVAVTRARDRLYFSSVLKDGRFVAGKGSLGEILPASFAALFERSHGVPSPVVSWTGPGGLTHLVRVCAQAEGHSDATAGTTATPVREADARHIDCFEQLPNGGVERVAATAITTAAATTGGGIEASQRRSSGRDERLLGVLVHRLFQQVCGLGGGVVAEEVLDRARALAMTIGSGPDAARGCVLPDLPARAAASILRICSDPRIASLLTGGAWLHELPFSMSVGDGQALADGWSWKGDAVVAGIIDSLVEKDGTIHVVELKTGRPRPEHARQLAIYTAAVRELFPGRSVEGILAYAQSPDHDSDP